MIDSVDPRGSKEVLNEDAPYQSMLVRSGALWNSVSSTSHVRPHFSWDRSRGRANASIFY
jgi:hypothetical protein